jgi:signal peptide peptidase SppA
MRGDAASNWFFDRPLELLPGKAEEIAEFLRLQVAGGAVDRAVVERLREENEERRNHRFLVRDGVAVLQINGVIQQRMGRFSSFSGGTSAEQIGRDFAEAIADDSIGAIVLDCDSPGGSVHGPAVAGDLIYRARGIKPVVAVANELAASAAYKIASAADEIVLTETAAVGSIGTRAMLLDQTAADAKRGLQWTSIKDGEFKDAGDPRVPLTDRARAVLQGEIDTYAGLFRAAVARNRAMDLGRVAELADGRVWIGRQAIEAGLADRIGTLESVVAELSRTAARSQFM